MRDEFTQLSLNDEATFLSRHSGKPRRGRAFTCEHCGSIFYRYAADIRKCEAKGSAIRFCSRSCYRKASANSVSLTCPECGVAFERWASTQARAESRGQTMYCSAKCRDAVHARARRNGFEVACMTCGKLIRRTPATRLERVYCSRACTGAGVLSWSRGGRNYGLYGHRDDIGHFVRSSWEANVARVLIALGIPYQYEPRSFRLPDGHVYRPDFLVAGWLWVEVKGQMTPRAAKKIAMFRATQLEPLAVIGADDYYFLEDAFAPLIPAWETPWRRTKALRAAARHQAPS